MNIAILLAAGKSLRAGQNKLWAKVWGDPLWTLSYKTFLKHTLIDRVILVVPKGDELRFLPFVDGTKTTVVAGGETRMNSFKRGISSIDSLGKDDIILDHNSANPMVTAKEISDVISAAKEFGAAAVSLPAVDTILQTENGNYVAKIDREKLRLMQTPQAVRGDILQTINLADSEFSEATDLISALIGTQKITVKIIDANPANRKITTAEDLATLCSQFYIGEDSHRFSNAGTLTIGGLKIQELPALEANSDGDVILHAIGRALSPLAAGENSPSFSEIADPLLLSGTSDSRDYLEPLLDGITIRHISISLECSRPKIDPIKTKIKESLAKILSISAQQISIEAMTGEDLTPFGLGEGIRCTTILQVIKNQ